MGLYLHFGAGPNQLPEPFQNLNVAHDIRKPLRFQDGSASMVFAEHVIEHVPFLAGLAFVNEVFRVLEPGGVFRLSFPDVARFLHVTWPEERFGFNGRASAYALELAKRPQLTAVSPAEAVTVLLAGWGHQSAWTREVGVAALLVAGFSVVRPCSYGDHSRGVPAELRGYPIDGHHVDVGLELAELETTVLEAVK